MEVGGPFWNIEKSNDKNNSEFFLLGEDNIFTMSGRTAIDIAIQDIYISKKVKTVYFPSYSCDSMLQPFIDRNINIAFYNVYFDDGLKYDINVDEKCDVFFAMNYFGYTSTNMEFYIEKFKEKGVLIIEDATHSLLSQKPFSKKSDYVVASLRKWFPIYTGGIVVKLNEKFLYNSSKMSILEEVVKLKKDAMNLKSKYINERQYDKEIKKVFSEKFKQADEYLKNDYKDKKIDDESMEILMKIDVGSIQEKIRENIKKIYNSIKVDQTKTYLIKDFDFDKDILLFVPMYFKDESNLKKYKEYIYINEFYCPSHWPTNYTKSIIHRHELSLVCDYRYSADEIEEKLNMCERYWMIGEY